mgnify:CR=1 FL=1
MACSTSTWVMLNHLVKKEEKKKKSDNLKLFFAFIRNQRKRMMIDVPRPVLHFKPPMQFYAESAYSVHKRRRQLGGVGVKIGKLLMDSTN